MATAIREFQPLLVVPSDDLAVQHLHELYAAGPEAFGVDYSALIRRSLGSPASYPIVSSRFHLLDLARDEGLRVPSTNAVGSVDDLEALRARQPLPWVLKADGTCGGHGVSIVHNPEEAERCFLALAGPLSALRTIKRLLIDRDPAWLRPWRKLRANVVAQAYVPGRPANCGFFCWEGRVLACICVEVLHAQGATGAAMAVRVVENPDMAFAAERLASRLDLSGFFGLDFVIEESSGAAYLIEMNPRCTPLCHLQLGEGRDMVGALRAQLTGEPLQETSPATRSNTITYFPQAWHWDRRILTLRSSFHDVPWEDPELVRDLMRLPWPDRGILARAYNCLRGTTFAGRASKGGGIFETPESTADPIAFEGQATRVLGERNLDLGLHLPSVVPLRREGRREPLFLIHGVGGDVVHFHKLVRHLEPSQPVFAILSQALLGERTACTRVEAMADYYLKEVRALQPQGPYHLVGFSFGGLVAFEMARQLYAQGKSVGLVGLIDNRRMASAATHHHHKLGENAFSRRQSGFAFHLTRLLSPAGLSYARAKLRARCLRSIYALLAAMHQRIPPFLQYAYDINWFAAVRYVPQFFPGKVTLFQAIEPIAAHRSLNDQWSRLAGQGVEVRVIPGGHETLFNEPQVEFLAKELTDCLSEAGRRRGREPQERFSSPVTTPLTAEKGV